MEDGTVAPSSIFTFVVQPPPTPARHNQKGNPKSKIQNPQEVSVSQQLYADTVFAPIDRDLHMERIVGGNETEVYRRNDLRDVVKLKSDLGGDIAAALESALAMRAAAEEFAACLGPDYSIPSMYVIARDSAGQVQVLVLQPFLV